MKIPEPLWNPFPNNRHILHNDEFKPSENLLGMRADHDSHAILNCQLVRLFMVNRHEYSLFPVLMVEFLDVIE